jgi:hypothetical protein
LLNSEEQKLATAGRYRVRGVLASVFRIRNKLK